MNIFITWKKSLKLLDKCTVSIVWVQQSPYGSVVSVSSFSFLSEDAWEKGIFQGFQTYTLFQNKIH